MGKKERANVYEFSELHDLPRPQVYEYTNLRPEQYEWCEEIEKNPKLNNSEIGYRVLLADRISRFPRALSVFVTESTELNNKDLFPDQALVGTKDRVDVVYIRVPGESEPPIEIDDLPQMVETEEVEYTTKPEPEAEVETEAEADKTDSEETPDKDSEQ